jgi:hypothetical protein
VEGKAFTCELWNYDSTAYSYQIRSFGVPRELFNGDEYSMLSVAARRAIWGFLRISTNLVPLGSKPPTTADSGNWTEWKFDGNLADSSAYRRHLSGGAHVYADSESGSFCATEDLWYTLMDELGFPAGGTSAQLDGTASYSLADGSSQVSYFWQLQDGPSHVRFNNRNSSTPTIRGLVFGTYHFVLRVTDVAGSSSTSVLETGAVATDNKGVVINADPNVDRILGPMIAYGRNPWGFADERAMSATRLRAAAYQAKGLNPPTWETPLAGSVSYTYAGANGLLVGSLSAAISDASTMTIQVKDASKIDLTSLPVRLLIGPASDIREDVRICSASARSGPATLTVCYDGRGQANPQGESYRAAAQAWASGTQVWQMRVSGANTNFTHSYALREPGPGGRIALPDRHCCAQPRVQRCDRTANCLERSEWHCSQQQHPARYGNVTGDTFCFLCLYQQSDGCKPPFSGTCLSG